MESTRRITVPVVVRPDHLPTRHVATCFGSDSGAYEYCFGDGSISGVYDASTVLNDWTVRSVAIYDRNTGASARRSGSAEDSPAKPEATA